MSAPEVTAAVERGAEALYRREGGVTPLSEVTIGGHSWRDVKRDDVYTVLAAALNVEEMARVLHREGAWCGVCEYDGWDACKGCRETVTTYATALRTALLGADQ